MNPRIPLKHLTSKDAVSTLTGGKAGTGQGIPERESAFIADEPSSGPDLAICLDALLGLHHAYVERDRKALDHGYELLVTELEEYRNAVPKA